jgi:hypothetical protein
MTYYLVVVELDVHPVVQGPFGSEERRDQAAKLHKKRCGDTDGIFPLDVTADGIPKMTSYSGLFFQETV